MQLVGISLGTLFTTVSVLNEDKQVQTIADHDGERQIPTCVAFTDHDVLTGTQAKMQSVRNFKNTITQFKSLLGKNYDDEIVKEHQRKLKLNIVNQSDKPAYQIQLEQEILKTPQEIMTIFLKSIKTVAESFLGTPVDGCVLSSSPNALKSETEELEKCAIEAGFSTCLFIKEPVAAVLAARMTSPTDSLDNNILVLDFGGHQFNASVIQESNGKYVLKSSLDDFHLGGIDLDLILADHMATEFMKKTKIDVRDNRKSMIKLLKACEQTKKTLSQREVAPCLVESLFDGIDLNFNVNRTRFELMIDSKISQCSQLVNSVLEKSSMQLDAIDCVFLIGGSSRVPLFLRKMNFGDKIVAFSIEPDELVSQGCCYHAKIVLEYGLDEYSKLSSLAKALECNLSLKTKEKVLEIDSGTLLPIVRKLQVEKGTVDLFESGKLVASAVLESNGTLFFKLESNEPTLQLQTADDLIDISIQMC